MMYDIGTDVQELACAAQSKSYHGSYAFHGATLDDLGEQLARKSMRALDAAARRRQVGASSDEAANLSHESLDASVHAQENG